MESVGQISMQSKEASNTLQEYNHQVLDLTIEHHKVIGPRKEPGDVAPHVELAIKLVDDNMDVDKLLHIWVGVVHVMQF